MESKTKGDKEKDMNEELCYVFLTVVLDRTAHHVVAACEYRPGNQAMTAFKNGLVAMKPNKTLLTESSRTCGV